MQNSCGQKQCEIVHSSVGSRWNTKHNTTMLNMRSQQTREHETYRILHTIKACTRNKQIYAVFHKHHSYFSHPGGHMQAIKRPLPSACLRVKVVRCTPMAAVHARNRNSINLIETNNSLSERACVRAFFALLVCGGVVGRVFITIHPPLTAPNP